MATAFSLSGRGRGGRGMGRGVPGTGANLIPLATDNNNETAKHSSSGKGVDDVAAIETSIGRGGGRGGRGRIAQCVSLTISSESVTPHQSGEGSGRGRGGGVTGSSAVVGNTEVHQRGGGSGRGRGGGGLGADAHGHGDIISGADRGGGVAYRGRRGGEAGAAPAFVGNRERMGTEGSADASAHREGQQHQREAGQGGAVDGGVGRVTANGVGENEQRPRAPHEIPHVPKNRSLEDILAEDLRVKEKYAHIRDDDEDIVVTGLDKPYQSIESWSEFGFYPKILENLEHSNYTRPRKIQSFAIPLIMEGRDVVAHAETGSGKSAAFLLPIIDAIAKKKQSGEFTSRRSSPYAVVLEPTRELVIQVYEQARKLADGCGVSVAKAYGCFLRHANLREISLDGCDIIIGTLGRLCDFFTSESLLADKLKMLVLDEADRLLDDNFLVDLRKLHRARDWPKAEDRQTLMFSATFPSAIKSWAQEWMRADSLTISTESPSVHPNARIEQNFIQISAADKREKLLQLLLQELEQAKTNDPNAKLRNTMVFVNSKLTADVVSSYLNQYGLSTTSINGNRPQELREKALNDFRAGIHQVIVTTDVCARGHDIKDLDHVINMDLPTDEDAVATYIHRIGRTGRLQRGVATSFFDPNTDAALASGLVECLHLRSDTKLPDWLLQLSNGEQPPVQQDQNQNWMTSTAEKPLPQPASAPNPAPAITDACDVTPRYGDPANALKENLPPAVATAADDDDDNWGDGAGGW